MTLRLDPVQGSFFFYKLILLASKKHNISQLLRTK